MPLYTRKQFEEVFKMSPQYISTNKSRGKVIVQGKYIDSDLPTNVEFINNWKKKRPELFEENSESVDEPKIEKTKTSKTSKKINVPPVEKVPLSDIEIPDIDDKLNVDTATRQTLELAKKRLEIKKLNEDYELAKIKKEKQLGLVIPVDLVSGVFARHFKSITDTFYQATDNMLVEISQRLGGTRSDMANIRDRFTQIINHAVDESKEISTKEIRSLIDEYSETKSRGERK